MAIKVNFMASSPSSKLDTKERRFTTGFQSTSDASSIAPSRYTPDLLSLPDRLLSLVKTASQDSLQQLSRLKDSLKASEYELSLLSQSEDQVDPSAGLKFVEGVADKGALVGSLFNGIKRAIQIADADVDKWCFKKRGSFSASECRKQSTSALEKMGNEIWQLVLTYVEKPVTSRIEETIRAFASTQQEFEALSQSLETVLAQLESEILQQAAMIDDPQKDTWKDIFEAIPSHSSPVSKRSLTQEREVIATELKTQGRKMLKAFEHFSAANPNRSNLMEIRREMDDILKEMMTTVQVSKAGSEHMEYKETRKMKRETVQIRKKVESLCKMLEEQTYGRRLTPPLSHDSPRRNRSAQFDEGDDEVMNASSHQRANTTANFSFDTEEFKAELTKHIQESQVNVLSAIEEQHKGISAMSQAQVTFQSKQEALHSQVSAIQKKLEELFPSTKSKGNFADFAKAISVLKLFAPEIRALNDHEFMEKLTQQIRKERLEVDNFMTTVRNEGYSFGSLGEVAQEFKHIKESYLNLKEEHDEILLKMIRSQSEFEIESEYQRERIKRLEEELEGNSKTADLNQEALSSKTAENEQWRAEELNRLRADLQEKEKRLDSLQEEKEVLIGTIPDVFNSKAERELLNLIDSLSTTKADYFKLGGELETLRQTIQTLENSSGTPQHMELRVMGQETEMEVRALLNLEAVVRLCGVVTYARQKWALVNVEDAFSWIQPAGGLATLTTAEMIQQFDELKTLIDPEQQFSPHVALASEQFLKMLRTHLQVKT